MSWFGKKISVAAALAGTSLTLPALAQTITDDPLLHADRQGLDGGVGGNGEPVFLGKVLQRRARMGGAAAEQGAALDPE